MYSHDFTINTSLLLLVTCTGVGPALTTEGVLQSISAALHLNTLPITGQTASRAAILKNPAVNMDTCQPHLMQMLVMEEDIRRQEQRVLEARHRLQDALSAQSEEMEDEMVIGGDGRSTPSAD